MPTVTTYTTEKAFVDIIYLRSSTLKTSIMAGSLVRLRYSTLLLEIRDKPLKIRMLAE